MVQIVGKALLVIERTDSKYTPLEIHPFIQSAAGGEWAHECAGEDVCYLHQDDLPKRVRQLKEGERARVAVTFEIVYTQDYWGECDMEVFIHKAKVLRIQRAPKFYISKKDRR